MLISVLGIFVADLAFFAEKIPVEGETIIGNKYVIGPGGKGSNQAVAAAKAGAKTYFISKIGDDQFGAMAKTIYDQSGVDYSHVIISKEHSTGAAGILVNEASGANAINVVPGAAGALTTEDIDEANETIKELRQRINELLAISKSHQNLMGTQIQENAELKKDNKALAKQVDDYFNARLNKSREAGW